jgi:hypothetical protein
VGPGTFSGSTLYRCTISGNSAYRGGGIDVVENGILDVNSSIVWGNRAWGEGDEIYVGSGGGSDGLIWLQCCDLDTTGIEGPGAHDWHFFENLFTNPRFCDAESGDFHLYGISSCANHMSCGLIGAMGVGCGEEERKMSEDVSDGRRPENGCVAPDVVLESQGGQTLIHYLSHGTEHSRLSIHDIRGRIVRSVPGARGSEGRNSVLWDGKNDGGERIAPGIYVIRIQAGERVVTKKMLLVR